MYLFRNWALRRPNEMVTFLFVWVSGGSVAGPCSWIGCDCFWLSTCWCCDFCGHAGAFGFVVVAGVSRIVPIFFDGVVEIAGSVLFLLFFHLFPLHLHLAANCVAMCHWFHAASIVPYCCCNSIMYKSDFNTFVYICFWNFASRVFRIVLTWVDVLVILISNDIGCCGSQFVWFWQDVGMLWGGVDLFGAICVWSNVIMSNIHWWAVCVLCNFDLKNGHDEHDWSIVCKFAFYMPWLYIAVWSLTHVITSDMDSKWCCWILFISYLLQWFDKCLCCWDMSVVWTMGWWFKFHELKVGDMHWCAIGVAFVFIMVSGWISFREFAIVSF